MTPSTWPKPTKDTDPPKKTGAADRVLNGIETVGNKLPEPFTLFLILFLLTAVVSAIMAWSGAQVQVPG